MGKRKRRLNKRELKDLDNIDRLLKEVSHQKVNNVPKIEAKSQPTYKSETVEIKPTQVKIEPSKPKCKMLKVGKREMPINRITVSDHAHQRCVERFGLQHTGRDAVSRYIHKHLADSKHVGKITSTDGNDGEMFVKSQFRFHLSPDLSTVITVVKVENKITPSPVNNKLNELAHREFRKLDRKEKARIRQLKRCELEGEVEIAECKLRAFKTRSEAVKLSCNARIVALENRLEELKQEIQCIKEDKRKVAYALASII
jgi:hypothetical protein